MNAITVLYPKSPAVPQEAKFFRVFYQSVPKFPRNFSDRFRSFRIFRRIKFGFSPKNHWTGFTSSFFRQDEQGSPGEKRYFLVPSILIILSILSWYFLAEVCMKTGGSLFCVS